MSEALELIETWEETLDFGSDRKMWAHVDLMVDELRRLAEIERKYNEIMAQEPSCIETIARQASYKFTLWKGWDTEDDDSIKTPNGNMAGEEREYWRDVVKFVTNLTLKKD